MDRINSSNAKLSEVALHGMYIQKRLSVSAIARQLRISNHKVDYWLVKHGIKKRSISEAQYVKKNPRGDPFSVRAATTMDDFLLFGMGIGLYWGEGNKRNKNTIRLGNTDVLLIKKFIRFLVEMLGISTAKLRFGLQIFSDIKASTALSYWYTHLRSIGVSSQQFQKPIVTPARGRGTYRSKSEYGVLTVYYSNIKLKRLLDEMLAKYAE